MPEPRFEEDYTPRQTEAAKRVIVDVMQVLASFEDCLVLVGGWVPDLLLSEVDEPHIGSIDVDLALDVTKLSEGRYAEMLKLLLDTRRYDHGEKDFQFVTTVDLSDGHDPVLVEVEFLAPKEIKTKKNKPKLLERFRVLKADGCGAAFNEPLTVSLSGAMISGAQNQVSLRIASLPDFLVMKAYAMRGRDKPKDAYDICFCLDNSPNGMNALAVNWKERLETDKHVKEALAILRSKFESVNSFGPMQVVAFYGSTSDTERDEQARRAFELMMRFLDLVGE